MGLKPYELDKTQPVAKCIVGSPKSQISKMCHPDCFRIKDGLESGELEPTAAAIEPYADRLPS